MQQFLFQFAETESSRTWQALQSFVPLMHIAKQSSKVLPDGKTLRLKKDSFAKLLVSNSITFTDPESTATLSKAHKLVQIYQSHEYIFFKSNFQYLNNICCIVIIKCTVNLDIVHKLNNFVFIYVILISKRLIKIVFFCK